MRGWLHLVRHRADGAQSSGRSRDDLAAKNREAGIASGSNRAIGSCVNRMMALLIFTTIRGGGEDRQPGVMRGLVFSDDGDDDDDDNKELVRHD